MFTQHAHSIRQLLPFLTHTLVLALVSIQINMLTMLVDPNHYLQDVQPRVVFCCCFVPDCVGPLLDKVPQHSHIHAACGFDLELVSHLTCGVCFRR